MLRISNHFVSKMVSVLLLIEILILLASVYLGAAFRFMDGTFPFVHKFENFLMSAFAFAFAMIFSMSALGMYQINFREGFRNTFLRLMPSCMLGFVIVTLIFYLLPNLYFGRGILGLIFIIAASGILTVRILFFKSSQNKLLESRIIFLGDGALAQECSDLAMHKIFYHK